MQSRRPRDAPRQKIQKKDTKSTTSLSGREISPMLGGPDPTHCLESISVPLPLSSPDWTPVDWALMSSLHCRSPSPVDDLDLQLISHPFQECLTKSSIDQDIDFSENSGSRIPCGSGVSDSSADSGILRSRCPLNSSGTPENALSDQFHTLDLLPSQYENDNEPLPARLTPRSCSPLRSTHPPVYQEPTVRLGTRFLEERDQASFRGGSSQVPPIAEAGPVSSLATVAGRTGGACLLVSTARGHLDQLTSDPSVGLTRAPQDQPRTALSSAGPGSSQESAPAEQSPAAGTGLHFSDGDRSEERGEQERTSMSSGSIGVTSLGRTSGLLDHLTLALMALQEVRREVVQVHLNSMQEGRGGAAPETKAQANPVTLRRITESLLEEESDEEEGDLCRICQSWGSTPKNPLLPPCQCTGSLLYVHHDCLKRWIQAKVQSGAELSAVKTCELCKASLNLDLEGFNLEECYRQRQAQVEQANPQLHVLYLLQRRLWDMVHAMEMRCYATFNVSFAHNAAVQPF